MPINMYLHGARLPPQKQRGPRRAVSSFSRKMLSLRSFSPNSPLFHPLPLDLSPKHPRVASRSFHLLDTSLRYRHRPRSSLTTPFLRTPHLRPPPLPPLHTTHLLHHPDYPRRMPPKAGPCRHCNATSTPLWRKGPPELPVLCNACGTRWKVKGTLEDYVPGQPVQVIRDIISYHIISYHRQSHPYHIKSPPPPPYDTSYLHTTYRSSPDHVPGRYGVPQKLKAFGIVLRIWYLVLRIWYLVLGTGYWVLGTGYWVLHHSHRPHLFSSLIFSLLF